MMKKGFSLIELLVSLVIISVTMVFISSFILNLKKEKNDSDFLNIPALLDQASISKTLNSDANKYGICSLELSNNHHLNITYCNNDISVVEITNNTLKYSKSGDVQLVRTLKQGSFSSISYSDESFEETVKLYKYIIDVSTDKNIEVNYYKKS